MENSRSKSLGIKIGLPILVIAIVCVIFVKRNTPVEEMPSLIRPVKTVVVGDDTIVESRKYPGKVAAEQSVNLAFQVDGPLVEFPVLKGTEVKKGQLLAKIDPRDYENSLASAKSEYEKAKVYLQRIQKAVESGAVSKTELSNAEADFKTAEAKMKTAQKALEDTEIHASFDGVVANTFVEEFENVQAKQQILSLQDIASVTIEVNIPEDRVAISKKRQHGKFRFVAVFDYFPDREFDVEFKEFVTEADPVTQTYVATFTMPSPDDVTILPGMTSTIKEYERLTEFSSDKGGYTIPLSAAVIDENGDYYVWKVVPVAESDNYTVEKNTVTVSEMIKDRITVLSGVEKGDRVASAGVHFLQQGQTVRLYTNSEN